MILIYSESLEILGHNVICISSCLYCFKGGICCYFNKSHLSGNLIELKNSHISDEDVHDLFARQRKLAILEDLLVSPCGVLHGHDQLSRALHKVHRTTHAFYKLAWNNPIGEITSL